MPDLNMGFSAHFGARSRLGVLGGNKSPHTGTTLHGILAQWNPTITAFRVSNKHILVARHKAITRLAGNLCWMASS